MRTAGSEHTDEERGSVTNKADRRYMNRLPDDSTEVQLCKKLQDHDLIPKGEFHIDMVPLHTLTSKEVATVTTELAVKRACPWPSVITHEDIMELVEMERRKLLWAMLRHALRCMDPRALTLPVLKSWDFGRCDG